jgi:small-conductance mechanosensitive channel
VTSLSEWLDPQRLWHLLALLRAWVIADVLTAATLGQLAATLAALGLARLWTPPLRTLIEAQLLPRLQDARLHEMARALIGVTLPLSWLLLQWIAMLAAARAGLASELLKAVVSLIALWVVIRLTSSLVRDPVWSRILAVTAWSVAALNIVGVLDDAIGFLDSLAFSVGRVRVSALAVLQAAALLTLLLWLASWLSGFVDRRVRSLPRLPVSAQLLFGKLFKIVLFTVAVVLALGTIGIDVTALAVFTGAVGVGIGFGLQAVISNFVAGMILILERSLQVGDFVVLASGVRGEVREINIRYTVVTTNDHIDVLVPNSEFVNGAVTNWTHGGFQRRMHVPFTVAYGTDKELVRKAGLEAAASVEHTDPTPGRQPQVWLVGFGESALNFELVVWLTPVAVKRPAAVKAAYFWALDTALAKYRIEIPFPQRDLHLRTAAVLPVSSAGSTAPSGEGIWLPPGAND